MPEPKKAAATTADELAQEIVVGIDEALRRPLVSRFISAHAARVMRANRAYWNESTLAERARLLELYNREPDK